MRHLLLLPLYYLFFVPVSRVILLVHDPLRRRRLPAADHYWYHRSSSRGVTGHGGRL